MAFVKATKSMATIKLAVCGQSGAGKTTSALLLAQGLGGKIALLDTENTSAALKADQFEFDLWNEQDPTGYPPEYFIKVIHEAERAGYRTLIIDSITHEWFGRGGCLEIQNSLTTTRYKGNSTMAWREVTPRHQAFLDAIQNANINIICTIRSKPQTVISKDEIGKVKVLRVGLEPMQRDGIEYEFTIFFDIERDSHAADALKDRTELFQMPHVITAETGRKIAQWLEGATPAQPVEPIHKNVQTPLEVITKPVQQSGAERARAYVNTVTLERFNSGETRESILKDYADILKTDTVRDTHELTEDEIRCLGNALRARSKQQKSA